MAIVGGGLGGLTLARVLQQKGLEVTIFEREASRDSRGQGGVLDLHPESGQWALRQAGLEAEFIALARPEGEDLRILDKHGRVLWEEVTEISDSKDSGFSLSTGVPQGEYKGGGRPEVDRPALRKLLIDSLRPGTIRWGHQLVSICPKIVSGKGRTVEDFQPRLEGYEMTFGDMPGVTTAEVVVGADGARSNVRWLLTHVSPAYTGASFVELGIPDAAHAAPECARTVGRGSMFALGDGKGIIAQLNGDGRIRQFQGPYAGPGRSCPLMLNL